MKRKSIQMVNLAFAAVILIGLAVDCGQSASAHNDRGLSLHAQGDLEGAIAEYTQAIALNPQYALAYYNRGLAYAQIGEREKAISDLERALELGLSPDIRAQAQTKLEELSH